MITRLTKACRAYASWKSKQAKPNFKPWLHPDQLSIMPRLNSSDILSMDEIQKAEAIDETGAAEENGANGNDVRDENDED